MENDAHYFGKTPVPEPRPAEGVYLGADVAAHELRGWQRFPREYPAAGSFSMGGVSYTKGLTYDYDMFYSGSAIYLLDRKYKYFSGIYGMPDNAFSSMPGEHTLTIYGDERPLAGLDIAPGRLPQPFSVDITGVNQLRIEMPSYGYYALADAVFAQNPVSVAPARPVLKDNAHMGADIQAFIRSSVKEYPADGWFRINGTAYNNGIAGYSPSSAAFYNVDGQYAKMSGVYGSVDSGGKDGGRYKIKIYGGGGLLAELSASPGAAKPFSVDIKGVKVIKIVIEYDNIYRIPALADVIFQK